VGSVVYIFFPSDEKRRLNAILWVKIVDYVGLRFASFINIMRGVGCSFLASKNALYWQTRF